MGVTGTGSCDRIQSEVKMARYYVARRSWKHFVYDAVRIHILPYSECFIARVLFAASGVKFEV